MNNGIHCRMNAYMFLCDEGTESECLQRQLVGTTQENALPAMAINQGDDIYLFNFNTGTVYGPFLATTKADCHDVGAWSGKFPVQVRTERTTFTRRSDIRNPRAPAFLRKKRLAFGLGNHA